MRKVIFVLAVLLAATAFACSSEPDPTKEAVAETAPSTEDTLADAAKATEEMIKEEPEISEAVTEAPPGGIFRRLWSDPATLDPHLVTDTTSAFIVVEVFSGLVKFDTELRLVPDVAESWEIDANGTTYTFRLREDVKFHNGKPVTADDFKWSIERAAAPSTASPVADTYLDDIVGAADYLEGKADSIEGVKVVDDHTLQITVDAPKSYILAKLTYPTAYVLDREVVQSGGDNWWIENGVGTGPFKLKEYRIGERIVLERFDDFYGELANVDFVHMNLAGGQSMAMYDNDEIDITGVGLFDLDAVLDESDPRNKDLHVAPPGFDVSYIGFNPTRPPFDDVKVRQALNHAVDKDLIATEVLAGLVEPAYGVLPPGFPGYNPDHVGLRYDPELAKQLFAESKYAGDIPRIEITVPGTGGTIGLNLEVVLEMWRSTLGVEVEIVQVEWATYLKDLQENKFQAFAGLGWEADYPDPQDFLDILFHTESEINHGAYSNLEVDRILEMARVETDINRRVELYRQAEEMVVNDAAWVPLWFTGDRYVLVKPHVEGYQVTPMIVPKLSQIYLEG
jgi:oligopeptide transport system substrate-binding protein